VPNLEMTLAPRTWSVREARHAVEAVAGGLPEAVRTTVVLLTSELASNAVLHARTPFTVSATANDGVIRVAVSDAGGFRPSVRGPEDLRYGGWGLVMVDAAATRWGVVKDGDRTTVWFEIESTDHR